jgi:peptide-methionine (R)-S-oxide reductase
VAIVLTIEAKGPMKETDSTPEKVENPDKLSNEEWKEKLTSEQFHILRKAGTERPNGAIYKQFKEQGKGTYYCAGCGTKLFSSAHKFDSHCGWPSFWDPAEIDSIEKKVDDTHGMVRTEVVCANCKGHLGHLFEGEGFDTPTDQRFCINGAVLEFVPKE